MKQIILDANFLVVPFQFNVRIFEELERLFGRQFEVFTLDRCLDEAKSLKQGQYHDEVTSLVSNTELAVIETACSKRVDDLLLDYAERGYILCTNDKELKKRLKERGLPYIYLRQKNHLDYSYR